MGGDTATSFDPERFLRHETRMRGQSFRPFGGGVTLCPGRFLARQEVLMFVATVMWRFDLKVVQEMGDRGWSGFPKPRDNQSSLGMMGPIKGQGSNARV